MKLANQEGPEEMKLFSWKRWSAESSSRSCRPWCRRQACFSERSHSPRRQCPGAFHCRPQGRQSHPGQEGKSPLELAALPRGEKGSRCSSFPWGPRFQVLILQKPISFPGKSTLILHTVPLLFSSLLLSPCFPQLWVCEAKKR